MNIQFIAKSSNAKIGAIPASVSSRDTCPASCPLIGDGGCYAEAGFHTRLNWDKVTSGERGTSWDNFLIKVFDLPIGTLWRHNVAGDLPGRDDKIDAEKLRGLTMANAGKRGFTYTHYPDTPENIAAIRHANEHGFTVNLSANSVSHALELSRHGLPVAAIVPIDHGNETRTIEGKKFITCPATYRDEVTCSTCKLCSVSNRDSVICFPAHGTRKARADIIARG